MSKFTRKSVYVRGGYDLQRVEILEDGQDNPKINYWIFPLGKDGGADWVKTFESEADGIAWIDAQISSE